MEVPDMSPTSLRASTGVLAAACMLTAFLVIPGCARADEPDAKEVAVFVGEVVSIKEVHSECPAEPSPQKAPPDTLCIQFDAGYEARYRVLDVLAGRLLPSEEVTFDIADHYGFPAFADFQHALLFVDDEPQGRWLEKYQGYAVHRTVDGSWASCGDPYDERFGDAPRNLKKISFANELGIVGEFTDAAIGKRFFDMKYLSISNGRIRCHTGVALSDLYEMVRTGVLAARGIRLPALDAGVKDRPSTGTTGQSGH
jgi:hypothetical protein